MPQIGNSYEGGDPLPLRWDMAFILATEEFERAFDFGDAPQDNYATLLMNNGAHHLIHPDVHLGEHVDEEEDGLPDADALGDDQTDQDDEDGVQFTETLFAGQENEVVVQTSTDGFLNAWLDVHGDGNWYEPEDYVLEEIELPPGEHMLPFFVPAESVNGQTSFRFRFSREPFVWFNGFAIDGEVEDYMVTIQSESPVDDPSPTTPTQYRLHSNYPNPFNPSTHIMFEIPKTEQVSVQIYDMQGSHVRSLTEKTYKAGSHTLVWDGKDENGRSAATGIYLCRLSTPGFRETIRMVYMK